MRIIAVIIDEGFEDFEYSKIIQYLKKANHEIVHLGIQKGDMLKGIGGIVSVEVEESINDASPANYDVLYIPGSYSSSRLKVNEAITRFVYRFVQSGKLIFTLGNGIHALIEADVIGGRLVTGARAIGVVLQNAGAEYVDRPVVEDANLISGRHADDIPLFLKKVMEKIGK